MTNSVPAPPSPTMSAPALVQVEPGPEMSALPSGPCSWPTLPEPLNTWPPLITFRLPAPPRPTNRACQLTAGPFGWLVSITASSSGAGGAAGVQLSPLNQSWDCEPLARGVVAVGRTIPPTDPGQVSPRHDRGLNGCSLRMTRRGLFSAVCRSSAASSVARMAEQEDTMSGFTMKLAVAVSMALALTAAAGTAGATPPVQDRGPPADDIEIGTLKAGSTDPAQNQSALEARPGPSQGPHRNPPDTLASRSNCPEGWMLAPPGVAAALRCVPERLVASSGPSRTPSGPQGCLDGWEPVADRVNPVLRCQPANLLPAGRTRPGATPTARIGCPAGWKPVPREVNRLLRCLPYELAANAIQQPGPRQPPGCPVGWKPVPAGVNPLMRCLSDQAMAAEAVK